MKKVFLLLVLVFSQHISANWIYSLDQAKLIAMNNNKFILVQYYYSGLKQTIKMENDCWKDDKIMQDARMSFVLVRVNVDASYYFVRDDMRKRFLHDLNSSIIHILDFNGKIVSDLDYYENQNQIKDLIRNFSSMSESLLVELRSFNKFHNFNTSIRVALKYLDYSLAVENSFKENITNTYLEYLDEAKKNLSKKEENYEEKYQKLELLELFRFAYSLNFDKLERKLKKHKELDILESNLNYYYFLKYMVAKGLNKEDFAEIDSKYKLIEGFDFFIKKSELILSKKV